MPKQYTTGISFSDETPRAPSALVQATVVETDPLYLTMKERFAQRPVWTRKALFASLPPGSYRTVDSVRHTLPQLSYYFTNGPWRMCYIAYGYDPRATADARIYQVLDRQPTPWPTGQEETLPNMAGARLAPRAGAQGSRG